MAVEPSPSTPLVDAVRRTHVADAVELPTIPGAAAAAPAPSPRPVAAKRRAKRAPGGKRGSHRRAIRLVILACVLLPCGIWLSRTNGLAGLFSRANSAATELATTNSMAADTLNLLGFGRIRAAAGLP